MRDIVITGKSGDEIGISAKHRNKALKHSRLSNMIDFGKDWYGVPCSANYWREVKPVFFELKKQRERGRLWRDFPNKHEDYYLPILHAFINEVYRNGDIEKMMHYILGQYDYYKIVKENGEVSLRSFNLYGSNGWGRRVKFPKKAVSISMRKGSKTTVDLIMDQGWSLSFRIHNAESKILPSLKFDVQLIGSPERLSHHTITYS